MDNEMIHSLSLALKAEIESAKLKRPLKLYNLMRKEGGLYVCISPLKLEGEGIIRVGAKEFTASVQSSNGIAAISGLEDCEHESIKEALLFQDQTAMMQKICDDFEPFKPSALVSKIFDAKEGSSKNTTYENSSLNAGQRNVIGTALVDDCLLIVGPAGTGKTKTIITLVDELLKQNKRVLVASHAHLAVENVFESIVKKYQFEEGELVLSIKTEQASLRKYSPKALSEEKAKSVKDELDILSPLPIKLASTRRELLLTIEPAEAFIVSAEAFAANLNRQIKNAENEVIGIENEKAGLLKRITKLNSNGFLSSISHLLSSDKKDELIAQADIMEKRKVSKNKELLEFKVQAEKFQAQALKQAKDIAEAKQKLATTDKDMKACKDRIEHLKKELADIISEDFFKTARLAGSTLMSAAINHKIRDAKFDVLIVDEASMANLPMLLLAMNCIQEKIIMFGDPMQLSPIAKTEELKKSIFDVLGISDTFREGQIHPKALMLDTQFRCHPEIACLTSKLFYGGLLKNGREIVSGKKAMYIKNTHGLGGNFRNENNSFVNERHQRIVIEQVRSALQKGQRSIGVISPFRAQAEAIQSLYNLEFAEEYPDADFKAATIHSFQGQEKDVVIFDFTFGFSQRGSGLPQILLGDIDSDAAKLLNVATTRARDFFVLVCDLQYVHKVAEALPNYEDQAVIKWLKAIEDIAFSKNEVVDVASELAA